MRGMGLPRPCIDCSNRQFRVSASMWKDFVHLIQCKIKRLREMENYQAVVRMQLIKSALFLFGVIVFVKCITTFVPEAVSVSSTINGRELPIYCVETQEKKVALSFDAAWGNEDTAKILDILARHNVHVTFFMTGGWVESYPEDVKAILEAGHDLGNHSENHKNMSQLSNDEKRQEIVSVHQRVKELTGYDMFLFRPPFGDYDNDVIRTASECGYYSIQWDVDSLDWKDYGVDSIISTVCSHKHLGCGSIILCHNGAKFTAEALDEMITNLKGQGYEIVPVAELNYRDGYHMTAEGRQIRDS